jgi:chorismate-pyruvate lyase
MSESNLFAPLEKFYERAMLALPKIETIEAEALPEPYKSLLVHERDMTSTLERFHQSRCHVHALQCLEEEDYSRLVVLELNESDKPIEFGAITIHLQNFDKAARDLISQGQKPLGAILNEENILYVSSPQAFFRIVPDGLICSALKIHSTDWLYGRCNRLTLKDGRCLAEIIEVLPAG